MIILLTNLVFSNHYRWIHDLCLFPPLLHLQRTLCPFSPVSTSRHFSKKRRLFSHDKYRPSDMVEIWNRWPRKNRINTEHWRPHYMGFSDIRQNLSAYEPFSAIWIHILRVQLNEDIPRQSKLLLVWQSGFSLGMNAKAQEDGADIFNSSQQYSVRSASSWFITFK